MKAYQKYSALISEKLQVAFSQTDKIEQAASMIADSIAANGWIYTSGTGHSHLLAEEIFYRAGGFARVIPILDPALMLHENASKSTDIERIEGYAAQLLSEYSFTASDVFIISSNSGRNPVSIEMAQIAQSAGVKVICLTNLKHTQAVDSRHSSGSKLYEVCDLYLDNCGEMGDASIALDGLRSKVGATSTIIGSALLHAIMIEAADLLILKGVQPEIWSSSNSDEGGEINAVLTAKYKTLIKSI
jgi:uncharacterized phosphosugar-binding protein